jgi:nucleoside-diphosphate-sugar epimerase
MNRFVTGGSSFIGKNICQHLLDRGYDVAVLFRSAETSTAPLAQRREPLPGRSRPASPWQEKAYRHQGFVNLTEASISESEGLDTGI